MKTSIGLLAATINAILVEKDNNKKVLEAFDKLDRLDNSSACKITCEITDQATDWWRVRVFFDWKKRDAGFDSTKPLPGDLEVIVEWERKNGKVSYTIPEIIVSESKD